MSGNVFINDPLKKLFLPFQLCKPPYQIRIQPSALPCASPEAQDDASTHGNHSCLFT